MALVASVVPMSWSEITDDLPLAVGLQLRNIALAEAGVKILGSGQVAEDKAREILGDGADAFFDDCENM